MTDPAGSAFAAWAGPVIGWWIPSQEVSPEDVDAFREVLEDPFVQTYVCAHGEHPDQIRVTDPRGIEWRFVPA